MNQDVCEGGKQGDLLVSLDEAKLLQVWGRSMCNGSFAVILYNRDDSSTSMAANFSVFSNAGASGWTSSTHATVFDVWSGNVIDATGQVGPVSVESHGVFFAILTKSSSV